MAARKYDFRTYIWHSRPIPSQNFIQGICCRISIGACNHLSPVCKPTCVELPETKHLEGLQTWTNKRGYLITGLLQGKQWWFPWGIELLLQLKYRPTFGTSTKFNSYKLKITNYAISTIWNGNKWNFWYINGCDLILFLGNLRYIRYVYTIGLTIWIF